MVCIVNENNAQHTHAGLPTQKPQPQSQSAAVAVPQLSPKAKALPCAGDYVSFPNNRSVNGGNHSRTSCIEELITLART